MNYPGGSTGACLKTLICRLRSGRQGVILLLSAILIIDFLGMLAFAVDVGCRMLSQDQLQAAADSAALAAAANMSGTQATITTVGQQNGSIRLFDNPQVHLVQ
jgi:Flp pilus assembly protein TadG